SRCWEPGVGFDKLHYPFNSSVPISEAPGKWIRFSEIPNDGKCLLRKRPLDRQAACIPSRHRSVLRHSAINSKCKCGLESLLEVGLFRLVRLAKLPKNVIKHAN